MPSASGAQGPSSLGLNLLTQVEEKGPTRTGLDVVAVHGINGDAFKTWKVENGGPSWLQDFLPQDLPGARIFSFGYESHVLFSKSHGDLSTFAHILLAQLVAAREGKLRSRPLVFLCHSMGGLVVKQASDRKIHTPQSGPLSSSCELRANAVKALIQARLDEREYPGIRDSTKAIIFLSTPHRGSNAAVWPLFLSNIVNTCTYVGRGVGGRVNGELIKAVKSGSDGLSALSRNFRNQTDGVRIVSCYEQNATTPLFDLVVDEHTGVLGFPGEKIIPMMGCDHRTVCRFTSKDDWNYKLIVREIKEATGSAAFSVSGRRLGSPFRRLFSDSSGLSSPPCSPTSERPSPPESPRNSLDKRGDAPSRHSEDGSNLSVKSEVLRSVEPKEQSRPWLLSSRGRSTPPVSVTIPTDA